VTTRIDTTGTGIPRRRDYYSDWHDLVPTACANCTCIQFFAKDEPEIMWEPGEAWEEGCTDRTCSCHTAPVIGQTRADATA
jgi:hypothetical protein